MSWFNYWGLILLSIIMIPNIIYAVKNKGLNGFNNKKIELLEQVGRYGTIIFMIFNVPFTYFGFFIQNGLEIYLIVNSFLIVIYCISWILFYSKHNLVRALLLSIIPSIIFLFSGIMLASILLIISAIIFAPTHIYISCKLIEK